MPLHTRRTLAILSVVCALASTLALAGSAAQPSGGRRAFLPAVFGPPRPANPFGFDLRPYITNEAMTYVSGAQPRWSRAGDVLWADVEAVRGTYRWEMLAGVEANIVRLRKAGIEPTIVVQHSPSWAQRTPGRRCSPPKPEAIGDFARFVAAVAARYPQVTYIEIWNEPDFTPAETDDTDGFGCWVDASLPFLGGSYYGEVLKKVYPAVKAANRNAVVLGGALAYMWPDDTVGRTFLEGILASGAGKSFDMLSFHAYGDWGPGDLLINKTVRVRDMLDRYNLRDKPLFATEIGVLCLAHPNCPQSFISEQANYAARIYAEALALDLEGALWFTLVMTKPGPVYNSQLIDDVGGQLLPRPAYYAFRNSAVLLQGARYTGPPLAEPPLDQIDEVQVLTFRKPSSTLYVFWVPEIDFPKPYNLPVPVGATAICTDQLSRSVPARYSCSDVNKDGVIPRAVNMLPQYVEVFD